MNISIEEIKKIAKESTPSIDSVVCEKFYRHDVISGLNGNGNIGIELGVAGGNFSKRMVDSGKFKCFFGVDLYEDHHNTVEYKSAIKLVGMGKNYYLLRMSFDDALGLFDDDYFDFIYFDGYAHTGEEGGKTFSDWYNKLKVGGIFAGDDYHLDWPLVVWGVNAMAKALNVELNITGITETTGLNRYPSWFFSKINSDLLSTPIDKKLLELGEGLRKVTRKGNNQSISLTLQQFLELVNDINKNHPSIKEKALEIFNKQ